MNLAVVSDIHVDKSPLTPEEENTMHEAFAGADLVICAGDVAIGQAGAEWILQNLSRYPGVFIPGNHEFASGFDANGFKMRIEERGGLKFLDMDVAGFRIRDRSVRIAGATLWTDFAMFGQALAPAAMKCHEERARRKNYKKPVPSPEEIIERHHQAVAWLSKNAIRKKNDDILVVVTHFAPSIRSANPKFMSNGNDLSPAAFIARIDDIVARSGADLWVHGHTHHDVDYMIEGTRVVSRQRGNVSEDGPGSAAPLLLDL
jgi:predicted phosphodiesterase